MHTRYISWFVFIRSQLSTTLSLLGSLLWYDTVLIPLTGIAKMITFTYEGILHIDTIDQLGTWKIDYSVYCIVVFGGQLVCCAIRITEYSHFPWINHQRGQQLFRTNDTYINRPRIFFCASKIFNTSQGGVVLIPTCNSTQIIKLVKLHFYLFCFSCKFRF